MISKIERRFLGSSHASLSRPVSYEARAIGAEKKAADTEYRIIGYSALFEEETVIETWFGEFKEKIARGAFARAIKEKQNVRALRNHDPDNLLGTVKAGTLSIREDKKGLYIEVEPAATSVYRDTVEMILRGDMDGQSFAFIPRKVTWENGKDGTPDLRIIEDVDLYDVGPVTYPAYEQTSVDVEEASRIHEEGLRELGKQPIRRGSPPKQAEKTPEKDEKDLENQPESDVSEGTQEKEQDSEQESTQKEESSPKADESPDLVADAGTAAEETPAAAPDPVADEVARTARLLAAEQAAAELNDQLSNLLTE